MRHCTRVLYFFWMSSCRRVFGRWGLGLPPRCWRCSSCPSCPGWPARCPTSCRSPSPTRTPHHRAAPSCTSAEDERDTHLPDTEAASEIQTRRSDVSKVRVFACVRPPFCFWWLSTLGPGFGASDLEPLLQRFLLRGPPRLRSPVFQSASFSCSGITATLCTGALQRSSDKRLERVFTVSRFITVLHYSFIE